MSDSREFDVIVWGATGFTGKWVARYLHDHYPQDKLLWALGGRNADKLAMLREFIGDRKAIVPTVLADSNDEASLTCMVARTRVIISTVGPYAHHGSLLVKACANAGTDYVDLCGEVPWMRQMIDAHETAAQSSGARIVHSCGFDSIPSDMGNYYIQKQAYKKFKSYLQTVQFALIKAKGGLSGGTAHSMLNVLEQVTKDKTVRQLMTNPYSLNPDPTFKGVDRGEQITAKYNRDFASWTAPFVMSAINTRVVRRSNALLDFRYGEDFSYTETMATSRGLIGFTAATSIASAVAAFGLAGITSAGRKLLGLMLPSQGKGPKVDLQDPGYYIIELHGATRAGEKIHVRVSGDADPGY
ncbi:MAG: saccharopine dehydrogenase, partial [Gammaproteobacteria bacterium]|nr:saccharopine dehydrogenase [Gammaproteobacteria bacterium]